MEKLDHFLGLTERQIEDLMRLHHSDYLVDRGIACVLAPDEATMFQASPPLIVEEPVLASKVEELHMNLGEVRVLGEARGASFGFLSIFRVHAIG